MGRRGVSDSATAPIDAPRTAHFYTLRARLHVGPADQAGYIAPRPPAHSLDRRHAYLIKVFEPVL